MGHRYVKEEDTFSTSANGTVPKPTAGDISNNKVLRADGSWVQQSGGGGSSHTYSTTEQVVGTWIDGKPLYERVMALTLTNTSGGYDFSTDQILNIKLGSIVEIFGDTFGVNTFASRGSSPSLIIYLEMSGANAGKVGGWTTRNDLVGKKYYCVVKYTKTTD